MVDARLLHRLLLVCILVGIGFSSFAAFEVLYPPLQRTCSVSAFFSCGAVDQSGHTYLGPAPDWLVGVLGFLVLLALDIPLLRTFDRRLLYAVVVFSVLGLGVAAYLAYVELAIIHALCPICLGAYLSDLAVLLVGLSLVRIRRRADDADGA